MKFRDSCNILDSAPLVFKKTLSQQLLKALRFVFFFLILFHVLFFNFIFCFCFKYCLHVCSFVPRLFHYSSC